jgi:hypothetical protein
MSIKIRKKQEDNILIFKIPNFIYKLTKIKSKKIPIKELKIQ